MELALMASLIEKPLTGEPDAGNPPVRFGGRGEVSIPHPYLYLVRSKNGPAIYLLLVAADGKPVNPQVLDLVAEPVQITGEVERQGGLFILLADPSTYRRVTR
jgi:hypothetical protein